MLSSTRKCDKQFHPTERQGANRSLVPIHSRYGLPCDDLLLRRFLLHYAPPIHGCYPNLRLYPEFHLADETISHKELPVRPGSSLFWT